MPTTGRDGPRRGSALTTWERVSPAESRERLRRRALRGLLAFPGGDADPALHEFDEQRRRLPVHGAEQIPVPAHAGEQRGEPELLGVEHGSAAVPRESVARGPDDVDV